MKRMILVLLVSMLLAFNVAAQRAPSRKIHRSEQTNFGAEEDIKRPVRIPKAVLQMLRRDERVEQCFQNDPTLKNDISSWFTASAINLNNDRQTDLVVKPENACLFGANIVPFWIFRNTAKSYVLTLKAHTLGLSILRSRTNGYRNVSIGAASAAMLYGADYKFNGRRYMPARCWEQSIDEANKPNGGKVTHIPCSGNLEKPYRD